MSSETKECNKRWVQKLESVIKDEIGNYNMQWKITSATITYNKR